MNKSEKQFIETLAKLGYDAMKCDSGEVNFKHKPISPKNIHNKNVERVAEMLNFVGRLQTYFIKSGIPDFYVISRYKENADGFFIELKSENGSLSERQRNAIKTLIDDFNFSVYVVKHTKNNEHMIILNYAKCRNR